MHRCIMLALVGLLYCLPALALDESQLKPLLERAVIGSETTLVETQRFVERQIPRMPAVQQADAWRAQAEAIRKNVLENVAFRGEAARWKEMPTQVEWLEEIPGGDGYRIRKLRYEAVPGMWIPALLYEPLKLDGKVPVVMNVNGHDRDGKAADYKQIRCINQAKRGMLALNVEWLGMGQLSGPGMAHYTMNQLDLCGTSGLAPFVLSLQRGLDVLLQHPHADPQRVAVAGLSGGGWQTIFISALDTRVTLANPVAGYSSFLTRTRHFKDLGDSEQTPTDLAVYADYAHLTAMLAPRAALLTYNYTDNCCFEGSYALEPLLTAARPIYELLGRPDALRSHVNYDPGTHNFLQENREALYAMLGDHFFPEDDSYQDAEIDCQSELKTKEELQVALPDENATFHSLAMQLASGLPATPPPPQEAGALQSWREAARYRLAEIVRYDPYSSSVDAELQDSFTRDKTRVSYWRLRLGGDWTVPVIAFEPPGASATTLVVSDSGRSSCAATVSRLLQEGRRVLAIDPFYFGESRITHRDFLFAFMVATVGQRPLGVQASQLAAAARWSRQTHPSHPITVLSIGPRTSLIALVTAVLEPQAVAELEPDGSWTSLKEVIRGNTQANQIPEVFCFGLLRDFDISHLQAAASAGIKCK